MKVMSVNQHSLGLAAVKTRPSRLGEALVLRESVVILNRRTVFGTMLARRIKRATVFLQQRSPWATSSACTRGAP